MSGIHIFVSLYLMASTVVFSMSIFYVYHKRQSLVAYYLMWLLVCGFVYIFGYLLEINASTLSVMMLWNQFQYFTLPFMPAIWLLYTLANIRKHPLTTKWVYVIFIIPVLTFIARLTNDFHLLFYTHVELVESVYYPILKLSKGPLHYVQVAYVFLSILISWVLFALHSKGKTGHHKFIARRLVLASSIPFASMILNLFDHGIDVAALFMPLSLIVFVSLLSKDEFIHLKPLAKDLYFKKSVDGIIILNLGYTLVEVNPKAASILLDLPHYMSKPIDTLALRYPFIEEFMHKGILESVELNRRFYRLHLIPLTNEGAMLEGYMITLTDITDTETIIKSLKDNERRITYLSYHDQLTGLYNRHYLDERLKQLKVSDYPIGVVFIDMNDLKHINDQYGHHKGDKFLKAIGSQIQSLLRKTDLSFRVGGDEFLVLLMRSDISASKDWVKVFRQYTSKLMIDGLPVSLAVGYDTLDDLKDYEHRLNLAEDRMYEDKERQKKGTPS